MRRWEKAMVAELLVLSVLLFAYAAVGARAYTGPVNMTSAALNDMRVNPSQVVTWTPGLVLNATGQPVGGDNSSLSFDGTGDYVDVSSLDEDANGATAITLEIWVKFTGTQIQRGIIGWWFNLDCVIRKHLDGSKICWAVSTTGGGVQLFSGVLNDGAWHHLVGTYDSAGGANNVKLYVDGAVASQATTTGTVTNNDKFNIANINDDGTNTWTFTGDLDEGRIYFGRALTPTTVLQHSQGIFIDETGLVLYVDFDGQVLDQSGTGHDGTVAGNPAYTDGWASVPVSTYFNATQSVASRRILVNSTDGDPLSTIPDAAPAAWGNYTATLAPDASIGNATAAPFLVDTIAVDLHAVYATVPTSLPATVYAQAYSLLDGGNLTSADTLNVSGYAFTWNTYTSRFETQITKTTPQSYTLSAVTGLSEATYGITNGTVLTPVTVTVVQRGSSLIYQYLPVGDIGGLIFSVYTQALNIQVTWLIIMLIGSVFLYRRLGAIPTALIWLLSWGGFVAVFPPVAINLAVGMLLFGVASLIFLVFFYWRRSTS